MAEEEKKRTQPGQQVQTKRTTSGQTPEVPSDKTAQPRKTVNSLLKKKQEEKPKKPLPFRLAMYSLMGVGVFMAIGIFMSPVLAISTGFSFLALGSFCIHCFRNWKKPILIKIFVPSLLGSLLFAANVAVWWLSSDNNLTFKYLKSNLSDQGILHSFDINATLRVRIYFKVIAIATTVLAAVAIVSLTLFVLYKMFRLMTRIVKSIFMRIAVTAAFFATVARVVALWYEPALPVSAVLLIITMLALIIYVVMIKKLNIAGRLMFAGVTAIVFGLLFVWLFRPASVTAYIGISEETTLRAVSLYIISLASVALVSLFMFIIICAHKKCPVSLSFLIADIVFTALSLVGFLVFEDTLVYNVSKYSLCAFGFGIGVGIMWTVAGKIFGGKRGEEKEAPKKASVRASFTDKPEPPPKPDLSKLPKLNGK